MRKPRRQLAQQQPIVKNASSLVRNRVLSFWRGGSFFDEQQPLQLCLNRCRRARNGVCEDRVGAAMASRSARGGAAPTVSSACREGMDCHDCGVRSFRPPSAGRQAARRSRSAWRKWVSPASMLDVCLCTLMTADRVPSLHRLSRSWGHLLSVAYLSDDFETEAAAGFGVLALNGKAVPHADKLTLSIVEDRGYRAPRNRFPFNLLRNVAVAAAPADYVCLVDVDFLAYPQRRPGCAACGAAARLRRWLPLLRLTPHAALVLPAFDASATTAGAKEAVSGVSTKRGISRLVRQGSAEIFAHTQYPLGHACDNTSRWLSSTEPFVTPYRFGCEPYLLYNRRAAPKLWEMFVAYGKDRVSFTYELAARGFVLVVQPEAFVVHHRTPAPERAALLSRGAASAHASAPTYGHDPDAWMVGETCWPDFENRVRIKYHYREGWCQQSGIGHAVNVSIVNESLMCVSQVGCSSLLSMRALSQAPFLICSTARPFLLLFLPSSSPPPRRSKTSACSTASRRSFVGMGESCRQCTAEPQRRTAAAAVAPEESKEEAEVAEEEKEEEEEEAMDGGLRVCGALMGAATQRAVPPREAGVILSAAPTPTATTTAAAPVRRLDRCGWRGRLPVLQRQPPLSCTRSRGATPTAGSAVASHRSSLSARATRGERPSSTSRVEETWRRRTLRTLELIRSIEPAEETVLKMK